MSKIPFFEEILWKKYSQTNKLSKVLQTVVLQNLKRAEYSTKEKGHFGLQLERYSHFTSPIRRYPDLMTHRLIKNVLNKNFVLSTVSRKKRNKQSIICD